MEAKKIIARSMERMLDEWFNLLRIPSVSSQKEHRSDMIACAEMWKKLLLSSGAESAELIPLKGGNPVVYGERRFAANAPTVLVYGHYDVMPADPEELWTSPPFKPTLRNERVYARGADDDKGQMMIQVKGFETALRAKTVACNVKFIIEGGEEIGSPGMKAFCRANRDLLKADVILVSDTSMISEDIPSLTTGLRGIAYWEIEVTGANRDLHSGHFGGAVANPANVLCRMIADLVDSDGRITLPHFYDDVEELSDMEKEMLLSLPFDEEQYRSALGVDALAGEKGYSTLERNSSRPSFDVCGIWGGYTGQGAKTVIPARACAKVSCRLVPAQNARRISKIFEDYIGSVAPPGVRVTVRHSHDGEAYVCPVDIPAYQAAERAFTTVFGKRPLAVRRGGSIPVIPMLEKTLGIKSVLMGFGLERDAIHSPDENFGLDMFFTGIEAVAEFYKEFKQTVLP